MARKKTDHKIKFKSFLGRHILEKCYFFFTPGSGSNVRLVPKTSYALKQQQLKNQENGRMIFRGGATTGIKKKESHGRMSHLSE